MKEMTNYVMNEMDMVMNDENDFSARPFASRYTRL